MNAGGSVDARQFPARFEAIEKVGAGAFGEVWRARHRDLGSEFAVKILHDQDASAAISELERTRGLRHPGLCVPSEWGEATENGLFFVASPFIPGVTLRSLLDEPVKLDLRDTCSLASQLLEALAYAHQHGVMHRDVKPENILIRGEPGLYAAVLLDFGLGGYCDARRVDETGTFTGTLRYASPEQVRGLASGPSADLYSLGLIVLECLVGSDDFDGVGFRARTGERNRVLALVRERGLRWAVGRMTESRPERRSVALADLLRALAEPNWMPPAERQIERRPMTFLVCRLTQPRDDRRLASIAAAVDAAGASHMTLGDAHELILFGVDSPREDDPLRAARLAMELMASGTVEAAAIDVDTVEVEIGGTAVDTIGALPVSDAAARARRLASADGVGRVLATHTALLRIAERCEVESAPGVEDAVELVGLRRSSVLPQLDDTPFIGRAAEIAAVERLWAADGSRPKVAVVLGEPGIGKSRFVREACRRLGVDGDVRLWRARCLPEAQTTPLAAIADMLSDLGDTVFGQMTRLGLDVAAAGPAIARMTGIAFPEEIAPARQTPERERLAVSDALVGLVRGMAVEKPLIIVIEDLHWADAQTLEYLEKLASSGELSGRLLLLATARTSHDLRWMQGRGEVMTLQPLTDAEIAALLDADLPDSLRRRIIEQAEGVPLFASEVARMIVAGGDAGASSVPVGLRAIVAERLSGISEAARKAAHLAAALGRELDWDVIAAAMGDAADRSLLDELVRAGILSSTTPGRSLVEFRHALIRDAVYDSIPPAHLRELHATVAACVVRDFPDIAVKRPEQVAQQFELAGDGIQSAGYWKLAGEKNLRQASYQEAELHSRRGLELIEALPIDSEVGPLRIELLTVVATSQFMVGGYALPAVGETLSRAMEVADELGESTPLPVLNGLWTYHLTRSHLAETQQMIGIFVKIADSTDPVIALQGCATVGVDAWYAGDFRKAAEFLDRAIEYYHYPEFREYADNYGYNGGIYAYPYAMTAYFFLGDRVRADQLLERMQGVALDAGDPYSMSISNVFSALYLVECGDAAAALPFAERQIVLSIEQQLPLYMAGATCTKGVAERMLGQAEQGLATLQYGMAMYKGMGIDSAYANYLTHLATTLLELGRLDEAEATIAEGLDHCATGHCRYHEPEFHRLRGELLLARGDGEAAEKELSLSLEIALAKRNVPFQLRTGATLLGYLVRTSRPREASDLAARLSGDAFAMQTGDWKRFVQVRASVSG